MPTPTYAEVLRLAEQLTPDEQPALAAHLQESTTRAPRRAAIPRSPARAIKD